jgi:hypothetical protein
VSRFDCNRDGKVDYQEFTKMLSAWGVADKKEGGNGTTIKSTGLTWKFGQYGSPFKQADEAREAVRSLTHIA